MDEAKRDCIDPAARHYAGGFGKHESGASHCAAAQMHEMPVVGEPVDAAVLAHRRNRDSISEMHVADL